MEIQHLPVRHPVKTIVAGTLLLQVAIVGVALFSQGFGAIQPGFQKASRHSKQRVALQRARAGSEAELTKRQSAERGTTRGKEIRLEPYQGLAPVITANAAAKMETSEATSADSAATQTKQLADANTTAINGELPEENSASVDPKATVVMHQIVSGDTLTTIWSRYGAPYSGALAAARAFKEKDIPLQSLKVGETVRLEVTTKDNASDITGLRLELGDGKYLLLDGNSVEGYETNLYIPEIIEEERMATGVVTETLAQAAQDVNVPYQLIDDMVDAFGTRIEFRRDIHPGDTFTFIYTDRRLPNGKVVSPGKLKAASLRKGEKFYAVVRHEDNEGKEHYFDESGQPQGDYFLRYPLKFSRISSVFSNSRFHPVLKVRRPHNGVDFAAPTGTPVRSVADGVITTKAYNKAAGNMVKVKHSGKYSTAYLHLSKFAKGISRNSRVSRGQIIGYVGMTGTATGPHLHYSLYVNGKYVDPMKIDLPHLPRTKEPIPQKYLETVLERLQNAHSSFEPSLGYAQEKAVQSSEGRAVS